MTSVPRYPVNLAVHGLSVLVVGGGRVALRKARELVDCGADVHVVAPAVADELASLPGIDIERRAYSTGEAARYRLVVAATDDAELNGRICADAAAGGGWANDATDAEGGAMALPARLRRGPVLVTVSTGGAGPGLATWLRDQLAAHVGPEVGVLADLVGEARRAELVDDDGEATSATVGARPRSWQWTFDSGMLDLIRQGRIREAKERLQACQSSS